MKRLDKFLVLSGLLAVVVLFMTVFTSALFFPGYSHTRDFISELSAIDSPVKIFASIGYSLTGFFTFLFGMGIYRKEGTDFPGEVAAYLLMVSGFLFFLVGFFPCDNQCVNSSQTAMVHEFVSDWSLYAAGISLLFLAFHFKKEKSKYFSKNWATVFLFIGIIAGVLGYTYPEMDNTAFGGLVQRLAIGIPFTLMAISSLYLLKKMKD